MILHTFAVNVSVCDSNIFDANTIHVCVCVCICICSSTSFSVLSHPFHVHLLILDGQMNCIFNMYCNIYTWNWRILNQTHKEHVWKVWWLQRRRHQRRTLLSCVNLNRKYIRTKEFVGDIRWLWHGWLLLLLLLAHLFFCATVAVIGGTVYNAFLERTPSPSSPLSKTSVGQRERINGMQA